MAVGKADGFVAEDEPFGLGETPHKHDMDDDIPVTPNIGLPESDEDSNTSKKRKHPSSPTTFPNKKQKASSAKVTPAKNTN